MYLYFLINNFHFALELFGAVVFITATWLAFDAYSTQKDGSTMFRALGFSFVSLSSIIHALNYDNDLLLFTGAFLSIFGLTFLIISFLKIKRLEATGVVIIPAFSAWSNKISVIITLLLGFVAYLSFRQYKKEFNPTWIPLSIGFSFLTISSLIDVFYAGDSASIMSITSHLLKLVAFVFLTKWVWQYLSLRIRESMILIFISGTLFLATVVTLAFSTILIGRITSETESSLLTDAKVFDLTIESMREESLAKVRIMTKNSDFINAVSKNDFPLIERLMEDMLQSEKVGFLTLSDKDGNVILRAHAVTKRNDSIANSRVFEEAVSGNPFVTIETDSVEGLAVRAGDRIISGGQVIGVLVTGFPLDNAMVDGIKKITGLEMFVYDQNKLIAGTALTSDGRTRIIGVPIPKAVLENGITSETGETQRIVIKGESFLASFLPVYNGDEKVVGAISSAKSEQNILDIANATNRLTLITIIILLLILAFPIYSLTQKLIGQV